MSANYDVVVVGAGPAGYVCAIRSAQLGSESGHCRDVVRRESGKPVFGGTCLNVGCIPSKALLDSSHKFIEAKEHFPTHGISVEVPGIDVAAMMGRKTKIVGQLTGGVSGLFKHNGVEVCAGASGKLFANRKVEVSAADGTVITLEAANVVLASGSEPISIPPAPVDNDLIVDSTGAWSLMPYPSVLVSLVLVSLAWNLGSVWGAWAPRWCCWRLWRASSLRWTSKLRKSRRKSLKSRGLDIRLGARVTGTEIRDGKVHVTYTQGDQSLDEVFDKLIVSVGRRPRTNDLFSSDSGVTTDERGFVYVNDYCATEAPGVWAIGDIVRGPMLAHKGSEEGVMVAERIAGKPNQLNYDCIPSIIYTDPEVAAVGKTEQELKSEGVAYKSGTFPFAAIGRALASGNTDGLVKIIADKNTDRILGAHCVGPSAADLVQQMVIAMEFGSSAEDIQLMVFGHPTLSAAVHEAALAVDGHAIHMANRKKR